MGSLEGDLFRTHTHDIDDPGHGHSVNDPGHGHGVNDPGHTHNSCFGVAQAAGAYTSGYVGAILAGYNDCDPNIVRGAGTGISIQGSGTNVSIQASTTKISIKPIGGGESRPLNAGVIWIIKT